MFRSHFTYGGHVIAGIDLKACTLEDAIKEAQRGFAEHSNVGWLGGFEIWKGFYLLHVTPDRPTP
jgi:hypothetical protein